MPTYVVELTPPGRAAVAVVLVAGPDALRSVVKCFAPASGRPVVEIPIGRIALGRWGSPAGEELIVCRRSDERIEIHCHGGHAAVEAILNALTAEGCQRLEWQDRVRRASFNSISAAARIALADATTERTAAILLDQLNGALSQAIEDTIREISAANWVSAAESIDALLGRRDLGLHLTRPWRIVVFGPPNVGKSSLINALAGYERAIVSHVPGTTRDVVTLATAIDGWPVQLADTAGLRTTHDELESGGIQLATATLSKADMAICVHDATRFTICEPLDDASSDIHAALASPQRTIHAINKIDLIPVAERQGLSDRVASSRADIRNPSFVSALTGEGVESLISTISRSILPKSVPAGSAVPFTTEQLNLLEAASDALQHRHAQESLRLLQALLGVGCQASGVSSSSDT